MNSNTKYRLLIWVIVILVATNLSTIGSFYYHRFSEAKETKQDDRNTIPGEQRTRLFRDQLNLNDEQLDQFRNINRTFNRTARDIEMDLAQLRTDMINELGAQKPDSVRLEQMALEIGNKHRELKQVTITFYLDMKKICTSQQQEKLHGIFQRMLNKESLVNLPQPGKKGGRWRDK
jgi:Spy/CpxP family protein refolding chaperone